jgi:hypothetical protein
MKRTEQTAIELLAQEEWPTNYAVDTIARDYFYLFAGCLTVSAPETLAKL